jgi:SAM-dependent methyltransferase
VLHQRYKDFCFLLIAQATWPNYWVKKLGHAVGAVNRDRSRLHLGCGPKYLPGFVNIDANPLLKSDIWLDVRFGLPFASGSIDSIYSTHMIEHFYPDEVEKLLRDCARVLKAGGGMRIIVPSLSNAILAFQQNRRDWFYDNSPRHFDSLGGRFSFRLLRWTAPDCIRSQLSRRSLAQGGISGSRGTRGRTEPALWGDGTGL